MMDSACANVDKGVGEIISMRTNTIANESYFSLLIYLNQ